MNASSIGVVGIFAMRHDNATRSPWLLVHRVAYFPISKATIGKVTHYHTLRVRHLHLVSRHRFCPHIQPTMTTVFHTICIRCYGAVSVGLNKTQNRAIVWHSHRRWFCTNPWSAPATSDYYSVAFDKSQGFVQTRQAHYWRAVTFPSASHYNVSNQTTYHRIMWWMVCMRLWFAHSIHIRINSKHENDNCAKTLSRPGEPTGKDNVCTWQKSVARFNVD